MPKLRYWLFGFFILILLAAIGFLIWAFTPLGPMPEALAALESDEVVQVETSPWITFTPQEVAPVAGFIFYPGGRVDPRSYAPVARAIAEQGYQVVIPPMPFNLAFFGSDEAEAIRKTYPAIDHWAIGGHSLGGVAAASFVQNHPGAMDALLFWAAYPTASSDLLALEDLLVASIYATNDGLTTLADIENSRDMLPADTQWTAIEGGNHGQFGWYGPQPGDDAATISRETQQAQIVHATLQVLKAFPEPAGR